MRNRPEKSLKERIMRAKRILARSNRGVRRKPKALKTIPGPWVTKTRFLKALPGTAGIKTRIAERLGVSTNTLNHVLKLPHWEDMREAYQREVDTVGDLAEETIRDMMSQRVDYSVASRNARWYLERKCPERGYRENKSITVSGGAPIQIQNNILSLDALNLPVEIRTRLLEAVELREKETQKLVAQVEIPVSLDNEDDKEDDENDNG